MPATSAAHNRLLFFPFLLRPFTVLMKKTRAVKQSIFLDVHAVTACFDELVYYYIEVEMYAKCCWIRVLFITDVSSVKSHSNFEYQW